MTDQKTSPAEESTTWNARCDADCEQWQVDDGSAVIATGIETGAIARMMAAALPMRQASQRLYNAIRGCIDFSDTKLPEDLVEAMVEMEAAWHKADGTTPEDEDGDAA